MATGHRGWKTELGRTYFLPGRYGREAVLIVTASRLSAAIRSRSNDRRTKSPASKRPHRRTRVANRQRPTAPVRRNAERTAHTWRSDKRESQGIREIETFGH